MKKKKVKAIALCNLVSISKKNKSSSFAEANKEKSHERPSGKEIGIIPFSEGLKQFFL
ncbi:hypothetical protein ACFMB7_21830 [Bacillus toyonensis]